MTHDWCGKKSVEQKPIDREREMEREKQFNFAMCLQNLYNTLTMSSDIHNFLQQNACVLNVVYL